MKQARCAGHVAISTEKTLAPSSQYGLPAGGVIREDGKFKMIPPASKSMMIRFFDTPETSVCIPWGDISTAYYSTAIKNIEVYVAVPDKLTALLKRTRYLRFLLAPKIVQRTVQAFIDHFYPNDIIATLSDKTMIWGEVRNENGDRIERRIVTENGYKFTAHSAVLAVEKVLSGEVAPGVYTPSQAFGKDFVNSLEGVQIIS